ncbi:hypothetical protein ACFOYW_12345 [Gryllotalpicola reticulitermitis]|uniref:Alternate signal-mediated exported protein, RER_14450 family n=1 Tax=Gryllotalpicola reticulitermitis TaxID=1184153 RepID=A0ABV8Q762_9MICO
MSDNIGGAAPIVVTKSHRRRRAAAMLAVASLATAGIVGATMAAFTDSEYAGLNNGPGQGGYAAANWNIQISSDNSDWVDTTNPNTAGTTDNTADDVQAPIDLSIDGASQLIPGDASTDVTTTFYVRNDPTSTQNAELADFKLIPDPAQTTDTTMLDALQFTVTDGTDTVTAVSYADLNAGVALSSPELTPGQVQTYTVTVHLPAQATQAENNALEGQAAYLIAEVDGTSANAN